MSDNELTMDDLLGTLINVCDDLADILAERTGDGEPYGRVYEVKRDVRMVLNDVRMVLKRAGIERD